jgi:hypothetical protein
VNDANSDAAPAYTVAGARVAYEFRSVSATLRAFLRVDNLFDPALRGLRHRELEGNSRFFEPAPARAHSWACAGDLASTYRALCSAHGSLDRRWGGSLMGHILATMKKPTPGAPSPPPSSLAGLAPPALANEAEIVSVVGKGEARDAGASEWRAATVKQRLRGGATVRTGDSSTMALLMQDQDPAAPEPEQPAPDQGNGGERGADALELRGGRAWMNSKGPAHGVTIDTPNATAAIRGTEWELEVDPAARRCSRCSRARSSSRTPHGSA